MYLQTFSFSENDKQKYKSNNPEKKLYSYHYAMFEISAMLYDGNQILRVIYNSPAYYRPVVK